MRCPVLHQPAGAAGGHWSWALACGPLLRQSCKSRHPSQHSFNLLKIKALETYLNTPASTGNSTVCQWQELETQLPKPMPKQGRSTAPLTWAAGNAARPPELANPMPSNYQVFICYGPLGKIAALPQDGTFWKCL